MKSKLPTSLNDKVEAYLRAMLEIGARFEIIAEMETSTFPLSLRLEISYLQLRSICELVTIGALIVQGDYSSRLAEVYSPSPIFKMLDKKYHSPFPQPTTVTMHKWGANIEANSVPSAMSRSELISLWSKSGDRLHRLKVSKFFSSYDTSSNSNDIKEVGLHVAKLKALLNCHAVAMENPKALILIYLYGEDAKGSPTASFVEYKGTNVEIKHFSVTGISNFFNQK